MQGGGVRNKKTRVEMEEYVSITEYFYKLKIFLTLTGDVMFINRNAFTIIPEKKIKLVT